MIRLSQEFFEEICSGLVQPFIYTILKKQNMLFKLIWLKNQWAYAMVRGPLITHPFVQPQLIRLTPPAKVLVRI